jgi:hypothetical protein
MIGSREDAAKHRRQRRQKRQRNQRDGAAASKRERSNEAARPTHRALHNATARWWTGLPRLRLQKEGKMVVPFGWT